MVIRIAEKIFSTHRGQVNHVYEEKGALTMDKNFGARLKAIRMNREMSIEELVAASGVAADTIKRFEECGVRPTVAGVRKLALALQVFPSTLLNGKRHDNR